MAQLDRPIYDWMDISMRKLDEHIHRQMVRDSSSINEKSSSYSPDINFQDLIRRGNMLFADKLFHV